MTCHCCLYVSFLMKNNISTKNPYFKESELTQISVNFRHLKIFLISKMYSSCLYACVVFVLLHETIGSPENHRVRPWMFGKIRKWSQTRKYCCAMFTSVMCAGLRTQTYMQTRVRWHTSAYLQCRMKSNNFVYILNHRAYFCTSFRTQAAYTLQIVKGTISDSSG